MDCQVNWAQCLPKHHSRQSLNNKPWSSLVIQLLRLHAFTAEGRGSTPGQGTKTLHATLHSQKSHYNKKANSKPQGDSCMPTGEQPGLGVAGWVQHSEPQQHLVKGGPVLACADRGAGGQGTPSFQSLVSISLWAAPSWVAWSPPGELGLRGSSSEPRTREQGGWLTPGRAMPECLQHEL